MFSLGTLWVGLGHLLGVRVKVCCCWEGGLWWTSKQRFVWPYWSLLRKAVKF